MNLLSSKIQGSYDKVFFCSLISVYLCFLILTVLYSVFVSDVDAPFARWSKDQVCDWLQDQGLGLYVNMARVWICSGQTLLQASQQDLDRVRGNKRLERSGCELTLWYLQWQYVISSLVSLSVFRSLESNTRCTERSCSWLCRLSAQKRRITRESSTITGWRVSFSCQSKTRVKINILSPLQYTYSI